MRAMRVRAMCVLFAGIALAEAKPSYEPSQLRKSKYKTTYPSPMGQISEERFLPLVYSHPLISHYPLPVSYSPDLEDFSAGYDQKLEKSRGIHQKYKRGPSKHRLAPKCDYRSKKQYPWSKYETEVSPRYIPRAFEHDHDPYRSHVFDYESRSRYPPPSAYHEHMYAHQPVPLRENVNIYITPPSKKRNKKARPASEEGYETSPPYMFPWTRGRCASPTSSYGRVYRSPMLDYEDLEESSPLVEYDPSAETSLQLYRQALYGASSSSSSSSDDSVAHGGRRSYYPKRSPQHPEEFFASLSKLNETSSAQQQQQQQQVGEVNEPVDSTSASDDTLAYINRILAVQSQARRSQNGNTQDANNSEGLQTDYSIFGEGYSDGGKYPTSGYHDTGLGDGAHNETVQGATSKEYSGSIILS